MNRGRHTVLDPIAIIMPFLAHTACAAGVLFCCVGTFYERADYAK
jgi:hypothetical protein